MPVAAIGDIQWCEHACGSHCICNGVNMPAAAITGVQWCGHACGSHCGSSGVNMPAAAITDVQWCGHACGSHCYKQDPWPMSFCFVLLFWTSGAVIRS